MARSCNLALVFVYSGQGCAVNMGTGAVQTSLSLCEKEASSQSDESDVEEENTAGGSDGRSMAKTRRTPPTPLHAGRPERTPGPDGDRMPLAPVLSTGNVCRRPLNPFAMLAHGSVCLTCCALSFATRPVATRTPRAWRARLRCGHAYHRLHPPDPGRFQGLPGYLLAWVGHAAWLQTEAASAVPQYPQRLCRLASMRGRRAFLRLDHSLSAPR